LNPHNQNRFNRFFELANLVSLHAKDARSTLDLAGNVGLASLVVRNQNPRISKSINTDYDYNSIEKSYLFLKSHPEFSLESYILNFMLPMHDHITRFFRSDIVFALAITHHLILTQGYNISEILSVIKRFSNKYVFIEFMPLGLWGGDPNSKPEIPDWYNSEWFEKKFRKQFDFIAKQILESHEINGIDEPHRVLFIGRVK